MTGVFSAVRTILLVILGLGWLLLTYLLVWYIARKTNAARDRGIWSLLGIIVAFAVSVLFPAVLRNHPIAYILAFFAGALGFKWILKVKYLSAILISGTLALMMSVPFIILVFLMWGVDLQR